MALPIPEPRWAGSTNRSSRYTPGLHRNVENDVKKSANPTARPATSAISASQAGRAPNRAAARAAGVPMAWCSSFS
jgi:hypothetical protein